MDKLDVPLEPLPPNLQAPVVLAAMQPPPQLHMQAMALPPQLPPSSSSRNQRHTRQEDWVTCLECADRIKPALPDRWRLPKDDCVKCLKARSRAMSADKTQIDNYVNHAYTRTGQLMLLMSFDPLKKEMRIQGAPILVERILNHDVQGFLRRAVFEPAVADTEEARHVRACSFKKALPLLPRKGLHRMTQDELRSFIGPLVCAYSDREQPGWSDESKRIDCWPEGIPWGNPKHGSWKIGAEVPNSIFRLIIANIYQAAGREDMLKPCPPVCRGACDKCCGVLQYDEEVMPLDESEAAQMDAHLGAHGGMGPHTMVAMSQHAHHQQHHHHLHHHHVQLTEDQQAALAVAAVAAAAAAAPPLPTALQVVPMPVPIAVSLPAAQPPTDSADDQAKRRRLEQDEVFMRWHASS